MKFHIQTLTFIFLTCSTFCYAKSVPTKINYDKVESFENGFARVERNGKFGFINKNGKEVIECKYHWINYFNSVSGLASFTDTLKNFGFIDKRGNIVCEPKYQAVYSWDEVTGLAYVERDGKFGFLDKNGIEAIPCIYDQTNGTPEHFYNGIVRMKKDGKYGILDRQGKTLVDFEYDYFIGYEWLEGFPEKYLGAKKGEKYFYINMKTFEVLKTDYDYAGEFKEGMATVMKNNKFGYIDSTFSLVIPCIYNVTRNFSEGNASVRDSTEKWGYVSKTGKVIVPCIYDNVHEFSCGRAMVLQDSLVGFINKSGKIAIPLSFDHSSFYDYSYKRKHGFQDNLCAIRKKGKAGLIDTAGNILLDFKYAKIAFATDYQLNLWDLFPIAENYAVAVANDKVFVVTKAGKLLDQNHSRHLIYFVENISIVCDSTDHCGFINEKGELIIPFSYNYYEYSTFIDGYAVVKKNNKFGIIDKKGKVIIPANYDDLSNFNDKLAKATLNGTVYFMDKKGKTKLTIHTKGNNN
jgi:hypothetical protein